MQLCAFVSCEYKSISIRPHALTSRLLASVARSALPKPPGLPVHSNDGTLVISSDIENTESTLKNT